jgi:hypothetical protein
VKNESEDLVVRQWLIAISQGLFYFPPTKSSDNGSLSARGRQIGNMRPGASLFHLEIFVASRLSLKTGEIIRCSPCPQEALGIRELLACRQGKRILPKSIALFD